MEGMLPSASISKTCWNAEVYEPSDDTFLLTDALEKLALATWHKHAPNTVVEIGCGSGFVICSATLMLKHEGITPHRVIAVDHSQAALAATKQTLDDHEVEPDAVQIIEGDLTRGLPSDVIGNIDLLLFNPPYVPTPDSEWQAASTGVSSTWAGGHAGRRVIDRLLPQIPSLLSPSGQMLMITVSENQPYDIIKQMEELGLKGEIYAERQADEESLQVLRIYRPDPAVASVNHAASELPSPYPAALPQGRNGSTNGQHQAPHSTATNASSTSGISQQDVTQAGEHVSSAPITIQYMSDLHLEMYPGFRIEKATGKYLVLAGDIGKPNSAEYLDFLRHCTPMFELVFVVLGNHEFYHSSLEQTVKNMESMLAHPHLAGKVMLLNRSTYTFPENANVRIVGCTLWSDVPIQDMVTIGSCINDYRCITDFDVSTSNALHYQDLTWLKAEIKLTEPGTKLVVVTHHAPMFKDTSAPKYDDSNVACAFATDLRELIRAPVDAWLFGHTHYSNYQTFGKDSVIVASNQRGYASEPSEIKRFDPKRCIEIR